MIGCDVKDGLIFSPRAPLEHSSIYSRKVCGLHGQQAGGGWEPTILSTLGRTVFGTTFLLSFLLY